MPPHPGIEIRNHIIVYEKGKTMNESTKTKKALRGSLFALFLCIVLLIGTTFAWFTDTASTGVNKIQSGNLDVGLQMQVNDDKWVSAEGETLTFKAKDGRAAEDILWEPGCTYELPKLRVVNNGNLALKYKIKITGIQGSEKLNEVIDWTINDQPIDLNEQHLLANKAGEAFTIKGHMQESAGNEYQGLSIDGISITVYATQLNSENDSFGPDYDKDATYPAASASELGSALNEGKIVALSKDITSNDTIVVNNKTATLDANGKTVDNTKDIWNEDTGNWSLVSLRNKANLTITGNGNFKAKENDCFAVDVQDGSTVTIKNGTFVGNVHAVYVLEGTAIIEGGTYSVQQKYSDASKADEFVLNCYDANRANGTAKIIVKGGTFINFNPADCQAEGAHTNFVANGYKVTSKTVGKDTYYTVVKK